MKLTFIGGSDEIGASSTHIEIANKQILIDAGIRHHDRSGERIPAFAGISKKLDAIILTHAHLDHSGALPVVAQSYPNVPIYLTAPTLGIVSILLQDAAKIMDMGLKVDGEMPLYSLKEIDNTLCNCRPISFDSPLIISQDLQVTFKPAGHILGAASVLLESSEGSCVISGDIHASDQITVPGLTLPATKPDVMVIESTYGGKQHASRALEETRLIERIKQVVENKGSVLIPAFAVGRSQELILLVSRAIERGALPKVPILVDGMVKGVCSVYSSYEHLLTPWLRNRIKSKGNPFFFEGGAAIPIYDFQTRKEAARLRPAIIISSSGMLTPGSPSSYYASELAADPKCLIAISGYQDEESPGRKLLELAEKGSGELETISGSTSLKCKIETFSFSAHSDGHQLKQELESVAPKKVVLVHGAGQARQQLAESISQSGFKDIYLPALGGEIEIAGKKTKRSQITFSEPSTVQEIIHQPSQLQTTLLQVPDLFEIAAGLLARDGQGRTYTIPEILSFAGYLPTEICESLVEQMASTLKLKTSPFVVAKSKKSYRLRTIDGNRIWRPTNNNPLDIEKAIREEFKLEKGLYKIGTNFQKRSILLRFHFPKAIIQQYADTIEKLQQLFDIQISIHPEPHQEALAQLVLELIPEEWMPAKPSIHLDTDTVKVKVLKSVDEDKISEKFKEKTGYTLLIESLQTSDLSNKDLTSANNANVKRLEINSAFAKIREIFQDQPHKPLRLSLKNGSIEATFITPEIGTQYLQLLNKLGQEIGYLITIRNTPDQQSLQEAIRKIVPSEWGLFDNPSFQLREKTVVVKVANKLVAKIQPQAIVDQFSQATAWKLVIAHR